MERQLANLTGLVQKALHQNPTASREFLQVPTGRENYRTGKHIVIYQKFKFCILIRRYVHSLQMIK